MISEVLTQVLMGI